MALSDYVKHFGASPDELRSAADAEQTALDFEQVLARHGLRVKAGSPLERICYEIMKVAEWQRSGAALSTVDVDPELTAERLGLEFFARKVVRLSSRPGFEVFVPHLALLTHENCLPSLSVPTAAGDANNKVFELLFGLVVFEHGEQFLLDHPSHSSKAGQGKQPDIRAHFGGATWAFECKTISGSNPLTMFERVEDAVAQIEESGADTGAVVLHLRRVMELREFWPREEPGNVVHELFGAPMVKPEYASDRMHEVVLEKLAGFVSENGADKVKKLFHGRRALPLILIFTQGSALVQGPHGAVAMRLTQLVQAPVTASGSTPVDLFEILNRSLHDV
jgi:hypothetical protein